MLQFKFSVSSKTEWSTEKGFHTPVQPANLPKTNQNKSILSSHIEEVKTWESAFALKTHISRDRVKQEWSDNVNLLMLKGLNEIQLRYENMMTTNYQHRLDQERMKDNIYGRKECAWLTKCCMWPMFYLFGPCSVPCSDPDIWSWMHYQPKRVLRNVCR